MKETNFIPILSQPQINQFAHVVSNKDKSLSLAFCLSGKDANHFGKDLEFQILDWQIENPQQLHHLLLDLIQYCRLQKLQIKFALCLIQEEQLVLATLNGEILLKRGAHSKEVLSSQDEINMIIGHIKTGDQLVLLTNDTRDYATEILELMKIDYNLEKLVSEITVDVSKQEDLVSIAFVDCQEKQKINLKKELHQYGSTFTKRAFNFIKTIPKKIKNIVQKIKFFLKKIKNLNKKQRQKIIVSGLAILLLIVTSIAVVSFQRNQQNKALAITQTEIENLSQGLDGLENRLETEPFAVRQETNLLIDNLNALLEQKKDRSSQKLIKEKIAKYEALASTIDSENSLDKLTVFSDWHSQYPDFLGIELKIDRSKNLYVLNNEKTQLLRIDENQQISDHQFDAVRDFSPVQIEDQSDQLYFLSSGIFRSPWAGADLEQLKEEGESDRGGELLTAYGPYLYLLNREKRNIYRYYDQSDNFSEPIGWLVDKEGVNFQLISDLAVDGDIWLAFENGQLLKFSRGYQEDFAVQGLTEPFSQSLLIASQENSEKVAVLEKKNRRLVILTKDGQVISEIKSNELAGVSDIEIDLTGESVYAVSGSVVYEITL